MNRPNLKHGNLKVLEVGCIYASKPPKNLTWKEILTYPKIFHSSEQPGLFADGNTIKSLLCFTKSFRQFKNN
jgi:hypothetical protein